MKAVLLEQVGAHLVALGIARRARILLVLEVSHDGDRHVGSRPSAVRSCIRMSSKIVPRSGSSLSCDRLTVQTL